MPKPKSPMKKAQFRLSEDELAALVRIADRKEMSRNEWLRYAIRSADEASDGRHAGDGFQLLEEVRQTREALSRLHVAGQMTQDKRWLTQANRNSETIREIRELHSLPSHRNSPVFDRKAGSKRCFR